MHFAVLKNVGSQCFFVLSTFVLHLSFSFLYLPHSPIIFILICILYRDNLNKCLGGKRKGKSLTSVSYEFSILTTRQKCLIFSISFMYQGNLVVHAPHSMTLRGHYSLFCRRQKTIWAGPKNGVAKTAATCAIFVNSHLYIASARELRQWCGSNASNSQPLSPIK